MEWEVGATAVSLVVGALGGLLVPRIIAAVPEPVPDPEENPEDFPDKVAYADIAARPRLAPISVVACAVAGGAIGAVLGWSWALPWLLYLVPVGAALAVIDYVTWYLPARIVTPSYVVVAVLVVVAALARQDAAIAIAGAAGFVGVGGYYGLMWLISPRIMAFGDVRLGALLGLALGPFGLLTVIGSIFLGALLGVLALVPLGRRGNTIKRRVPFGPFLVVGALLALVLGQLVVAG